MVDLKGIWEQYYAYILMGLGVLVALVLGGSSAARRRHREPEDDAEVLYVTVRKTRKAKR